MAAEFFGTWAAGQVLETIVDYGAEQIGVAWNLEKEASQLKNKLRYAVAILRDIDERKLHQHSVKVWVEDLQEIVFEADDLLDKLHYGDLRQIVEQPWTLETVRGYVSPTNNFFFSRLEMTNKIKEIIETLRLHYNSAKPLALTALESSIIEREKIFMENRHTESFLDFDRPLQERDAEVSNILERVMKYSTNEHHMFVISIFGMGGLGKTTLAKMVFNHETIKRHFHKTIWVCVSKQFIVTKILKKIYEDLELQGSDLKSKQALVRRLRKEMQDKKYFLVLDDVWDTEKRWWEDLSDCLKQISGKFGNCIMVTTRSSEVAEMVGSVYPHQVEKLSNDQLWALFKTSANANQSSMKEMLENKKEALVKKMSGLPLVAKVLGGAVKFERDYESWKTKVESMIARNISIDDTDYVFSILKLSVDYLPHPVLKQCFAYCSHFPQDYDFEKDDLIQMWIAEGFIQPHQETEDLRMENIGEEYFNSLLSRSLFQDVKMDENNRIVGFKMHDLMHDIAVAISSHPRRESNPNNLSRESAKKLRTLILHDEDIDYKVLDDLSSLRVLKLNRSYWDNDFHIPLNKLIHLRYLNISRFAYDLGPKLHLIFELYNLQTLKLGLVDQLKNLKNLVNLRHLEYYTHMAVLQNPPEHIGKLIHLQTLSKFEIGLEKGCKIEELGPLKNLKGKLSLKNLRHVQSKEEAMAAKLGEKKNLRHLIFDWLASGEDDDNYDDHKQVLEGLPPHKNLQVLEIHHFQGRCWPKNIFVGNLVEIYFFNCERCVELPMLGKLPNLKKLIIEGMNSVRSIGNEFYGIDSNDHTNSFAFPNLAELHIVGMKKLEKWDEETVVIASNLFGCLKKLDICGCEQLAKLPSELEGCQSIEYLTIDYCSNLMLNVKNLHNLHSLEICGLKRWPEGLDDQLTHLKKLRIPTDFDNKCFESSELPQQLQHLTNLEFLEIVGFLDIEALPEWLGNLTSLTTLKFECCYKLKELPSREVFLRLTKLKDLFVNYCTELSKEQEMAKLSDLSITMHWF